MCHFDFQLQLDLDILYCSFQIATLQSVGAAGIGVTTGLVSLTGAALSAVVGAFF